MKGCIELLVKPYLVFYKILTLTSITTLPVKWKLTAAFYTKYHFRQ